MMTNFKIRPFTPQDQSAAQCLILKGLGDHFGFIDPDMNPDLDDIWQYYVTAGAVFVVAESAGVIVGTGALVEEGANGRLLRMSVHEKYQRQGIGRSLVRHLRRQAEDLGYIWLLVETNNDWYDAIGLYQSCGFREYDRDAESVYERLLLRG